MCLTDEINLYFRPVKDESKVEQDELFLEQKSLMFGEIQIEDSE